MKKKLLLFSFIFFFMFIINGCGKNTASVNSTKENKIKVSVSFNALREFVSYIGKDKVNIYTVIPDGVEPHDFEPKPKDLKEIGSSKLFIYNGLGMESWVLKTIDSIGSNELVTLDSSKGCNLIKVNNSYDPHIWLSLKESKKQCENIKDALIKVDGKNKDYYEKNFKELSINLDKLYKDYENKFKDIKNKNFVTGHSAFGYLCRDFDLKEMSVEGVFAEGEPTPQKLKELVLFCKDNKVSTIFMEELASPKVSQTLAKEVSGKVEKIYTLESKEDNLDYIKSMEYNLNKIYDSLK